MQYCDVCEVIPVSAVNYVEEVVGARTVDMKSKHKIMIVGSVTGKEARKAIETALPKASRTGVVIRSIKRASVKVGMSEAKFRRYSVPFDEQTGEPLEPFPLTPSRRRYDTVLQKYFALLITADGRRLGW